MVDDGHTAEGLQKVEVGVGAEKECRAHRVVDFRLVAAVGLSLLQQDVILSDVSVFAVPCAACLRRAAGAVCGCDADVGVLVVVGIAESGWQVVVEGVGSLVKLFGIAEGYRFRSFSRRLLFEPVAAGGERHAKCEQRCCYNILVSHIVFIYVMIRMLRQYRM